MAAIDRSLIAARADHALVHLVRRKKSWAAREPGVILVFCIVGAVAILLISLALYKRFMARRAARV